MGRAQGGISQRYTVSGRQEKSVLEIHHTAWCPQGAILYVTLKKILLAKTSFMLIKKMKPMLLIKHWIRYYNMSKCTVHTTVIFNSCPRKSLTTPTTLLWQFCILGLGAEEDHKQLVFLITTDKIQNFPLFLPNHFRSPLKIEKADRIEGCLFVLSLSILIRS